jgi:hypothetical protein
MNVIERKLLKIALQKVSSNLENYKKLPDNETFINLFNLGLEIPVNKIREKSVTTIQKMIKKYVKTL